MPHSRLSGGAREDARLVRACVQGEKEAFEVLVRKYQDSVYHLVYRMVGDKEEAKDLAQEAFLKAYQRLDTYQSRWPFRAWLFRVAANGAIDHLRKTGRTLEEEPLFCGDCQDGHSRRSGSPLGSESDVKAGQPEEVAISNEAAGVVHQALRGLPDNYRAVVVLHHLEGMSYKDIGRVLGVPRNTAKTWASRARALLARSLEGVV